MSRLERKIAAKPIILTEETLSIPEAAKHADALSIRMPLTDADHKKISDAKQDVGAAIEKYRKNGQTAEMLRAMDVWFALEAKQPRHAVGMGALNNMMYNIPQMASASAVAWSPEFTSDSNRQLKYMAGTYGIEGANPHAYKFGGDLAKAGSAVKTVTGLPDDSSKILSSIGRSLIEYILEDQFSGTVNKNADMIFE